MRSTSKAEAAPTRGLVPTLSRVRAVAFRFGASRWAAPLGRVALFATGLIVLAVIGNSALATSPKALGTIASAAPLLAEAAPTTDSGAPPLSPSPVAPTAPASAPTREPGAHGRATPDDPVLLNVASLDDLQRLPGVGPKRARAIFDLRAHIGKFRHVEDLLRVKGIGRSTLKKLRPLVRLDAPSPATGGAGDTTGGDAGVSSHGS